MKDQSWRSQISVQLNLSPKATCPERPFFTNNGEVFQDMFYCNILIFDSVFALLDESEYYDDDDNRQPQRCESIESRPLKLPTPPMG